MTYTYLPLDIMLLLTPVKSFSTYCIYWRYASQIMIISRPY